MAYQRMSDEEMEEVDRRSREDELRRVQERGPKPGPAPEVTIDPRLGFDPRFPPQQVIVMREPLRRTAGGDVPMESNESEADRNRRLAPQLRIEALEARVAKLEDILGRQLGAALNTEGTVYR